MNRWAGQQIDDAVWRHILSFFQRIGPVYVTPVPRHHFPVVRHLQDAEDRA